MSRCHRIGVLFRQSWSFALLLLAVPALAADDPPDRRRTPVVEVFEQCRDAVVNISTTRVVRMRSLYGSPLDSIFDFGPPRARDQRIQSVGSGVVVHESGYIVTNAHVVSQASDVQVTFADKKTLPAEVVAVDSEHDLAVLKVSAPRPLKCAKLGRSSDILIGETVVAIGNPLGLQHSVTAGIVSALDRDLQFSDDVVYKGLIQTDAPINPGNSGGPLLNLNAELIGINSAIRGDAQNIGFAIPVDRLWELLPKLLDIERRERVRFGADVSGTDARVVTVRKDSPAAAAGLLPGDRIVRFNDQPLRDGIDYYVHLLGQKPDSQVRLAVLRGSKTLDVAVLLQSIPLPDGRELATRLFGLELSEVGADERRKSELPDYVGLMVQAVTRGSPADRAQIHPRDFLLRIDRVPVTALKDVGLALEQTQPGERVHVEGLRLDADFPFFWTVTLQARR
jgi:serine protease Do